jgi:hypothetical protein
VTPARATVVGVAVLAVHAAALPVLLARCQRDDLWVRLRGAPVATQFYLYR